MKLKEKKRKITLIIVGMVTLFLAGCSGGIYNGFSKNPMSKIIIVKYMYGNGEVPYITSSEYKVIKKMATACQLQITPQLSPPAEAAASGAVVYGVSSAIGVGGGSQFFPGAILKQYSGYGATVGLLNGGAYGLTMWSFADVSAIASCARDFIKRAGLRDIFIYPSYVRARHRVPRRKGPPIQLQHSTSTKGGDGVNTIPPP